MIEQVMGNFSHGFFVENIKKNKLVLMKKRMVIVQSVKNS